MQEGHASRTFYLARDCQAWSCVPGHRVHARLQPLKVSMRKLHEDLELRSYDAAANLGGRPSVVVEEREIEVSTKLAQRILDQTTISSTSVHARTAGHVGIFTYTIHHQEDANDLQARMLPDLRALVLSYVADAIITTTTNSVEHSVTVDELMALREHPHGILPVVTLLAVQDLRLTGVRLPYVRRMDGPIQLSGDCHRMFADNQEPSLQLNAVDTSAVTNMRGMFADSAYNQSLSLWDTRNVTTMQGMFCGATRFDQVLPLWDTRNVTTMEGMFHGATHFDQILPLWDTRKVTNMASMFGHATRFNKVLPLWDTRNVTTMEGMFCDAQRFNQALPRWNTSNVIQMQGLFQDAHQFNQALPQWNTTNVTQMQGMFQSAKRFNQALPQWNTTNVTNMSYMFAGAVEFNQALPPWNTTNVTHKDFMFLGAHKFNQTVCYLDQEPDDAPCISRGQGFVVQTNNSWLERRVAI
jgi:hypothetical protein